MLPVQGVQVPSLVWELRVHMPCGAAKKLKRKKYLVEIKFTHHTFHPFKVSKNSMFFHVVQYFFFLQSCDKYVLLHIL